MTTTEKITQHIDQNSHLYTPGSTFDFNDLINRTSHIFPSLTFANPNLTRDASKFVSAYGQMNKVLALRGLTIKSSNYYNNYEILELDRTRNKIASLRRSSTVCTQAANTLEVGLRVHNQRWSTLSTEEHETTEHHINRSTLFPRY